MDIVAEALSRDENRSRSFSGIQRTRCANVTRVRASCVELDRKRADKGSWAGQRDAEPENIIRDTFIRAERPRMQRYCVVYT